MGNEEDFGYQRQIYEKKLLIVTNHIHCNADINRMLGSKAADSNRGDHHKAYA